MAGSFSRETFIRGRSDVDVFAQISLEDIRCRHLIEKLQALPIMSNECPTLAAMLINGCKGRFEQESLGPLNSSSWPFYS